MPRKTANPRTGKPAAASTESRDDSIAGANGAAAAGVEQKFVALAEQMGRLIGTVQARAEGWLDPKYMRDQISRIQDGAADLLSHLGTGGKAADAPAALPARGRSGGKVDAPGKKHRPPPPALRQAKAAGDRVVKMKAVRRPISRPRQG
ncbi:MAG: hypothetical protein ABI868_12825 [Acidobacteriota bacterium]